MLPYLMYIETIIGFVQINAVLQTIVSQERAKQLCDNYELVATMFKV